MELSSILSEEPKGLHEAQFCQLAGKFGHHPATQQGTVQADQTVKLDRTRDVLGFDEGLHPPWAAPDFSQGPLEFHEIRGVLRVFIETCQRWKLSLEDRVVLLGYRFGDSVGMQVLNGRLRIHSRDITDRSGYVIAISIGLGILCGESIDAENQWLRRPRDILDRRSPLDYMLEGQMINLITINRMVELERGL